MASAMKTSISHCAVSPGRAAINARPGSFKFRCLARTTPSDHNQQVKNGSEKPHIMKKLQQVSLASAGAATLASSAGAAFAEEAVKKAAPSINPFANISSQEKLILLLPVTVYSIFYIVRSINPKIKFGDVFFACVFSAVLGNIVSILAFKTRLF
eukprot:CAMPEP_0117668838 /NCGR_PEP_ID=MMETSP0804-20121206/11780_1 /TAXON_ID=1074897 /ORGANISM="Tetraselmis astigmatica, Strain CCMP880" /LENGTH=154 /DNA_ID=CAMNT_0005476791 /DNA_START=93 /DNA_END=557 /DNA_ORIENTATION=+